MRAPLLGWCEPKANRNQSCLGPNRQNPVLLVIIPIPTKIGPKMGGAPKPPNWDPMLTHFSNSEVPNQAARLFTGFRMLATSRKNPRFIFDGVGSKVESVSSTAKLLPGQSTSFATESACPADGQNPAIRTDETVRKLGNTYQLHLTATCWTIGGAFFHWLRRNWESNPYATKPNHTKRVT